MSMAQQAYVYVYAHHAHIGITIGPAALYGVSFLSLWFDP